MQEKITSFSGKYRWLSNFFPVSICYDGITYPSVEHAFQAAKSLDPQSRVHDPDVAYMIGNNLYINTGTVYLWNNKAYIEAVHINSPLDNAKGDTRL